MQCQTPIHCVINSQQPHCDKHFQQERTQSVFALLPQTAKTTDFTFTSIILLSGSLRLGVQKNIPITCYYFYYYIF